MENLSRTKPALRTTGQVTGNFGRPKVKAGSNANSVPANSRESLGNFPTQREYAERLRLAYHSTTDTKLKAFIVDELKKIEA